MSDISIRDLEKQCIDLKKKTITMIYKAQSGHPGGALSAAEFTTACYFKEMNIDPKNPDWADRDRFVLSKGHVCPIQYAALATKGYFDLSVLDTLRKEGSPLQGHPSMTKCKGIDISTGSLGQGLACGVGMAMAGKADGKSYDVYAVLGDGECDEGEIWEAVGTAHKYKCDNLIIFVDWNNLQLDGTVEEIMPHIDLAKKFEAFGCDVYQINGNDMGEVVDAIEKCKANRNGKPKCIVGKTVKGNGVSYMENQVGWHGIAPNDDEYAQAMKELDEALAKIA